MQNERFNFKKAKEQIDLVDYLASLGYHPSKQNDYNYWYLSPLHEEHTASFKIDRSNQTWYDHGTGQGGDLIDFIRAYHHYEFREALATLKEYLHMQDLTFKENQIQNIPYNDTVNTSSGKDKRIHILAERPVQRQYLRQYIQGRGISFLLASRYLKEVDYSLYGKTFTALGFQNDAGGYELRNKYFKGSSAPKAPTIILLNEEQKPITEQKLAVIEGFFSMLSFLELLENNPLLFEKADNILVLNSLSFLHKSQDLITAYGHTDLYLDGDNAGKKASGQTLLWSDKLRDRSVLYEGSNDLNTSVCSQKSHQKEPEEPIKSYGMRP